MVSSFLSEADQQNPRSARSTNRHTEIDGIRGWAALVVVVFHFLLELFGVAYPGLQQSALFPLMNGELAVFVFFVLSGDALSIGFITTADDAVVDRLIAKRYLRLTIPIFMACLTTYVLMKAGLTYHVQAAAIVHREDWLGVMINFVPHLQQLVRYALYGVYAQHSIQTSFNPFMWTMSVEMIGSLLVFSFLYVSRSINRPAIVAGFISVGLYLFNSWFALFFAGIVLGYWRKSGVLDRLQLRVSAQVLSSIIIIAIASLVSALGRLRSDSQYSFYLNEFFAFMFVAAVYVNRLALMFFRLGVSQFLGAISFPLYLIQFCVLVSYTSFFITKYPLLSRGG